MSGFLTTHVLDTSAGIPAAAMAVRLLKADDEGEYQLVKSCVTNDDGRVDSPIIAQADFALGCYRLSFAVADYFRGRGIDLAEPAFLDLVHIDFGIADLTSHYHVPLLVSPYSYSTYRGS